MTPTQLQEKRKDLAREEFFNTGFWESRTPPERAVTLFDQAYDLGFKARREEDQQAEVQQAFVDGKRDVESRLGLYEGAEVLVAAPGYSRLVQALAKAHDHAAHGKGKERHANSLPFEQQRMLSIARTMKDPAASLAYQVCKKVTEGLQFEQADRVLAELAGAINYIAGMIILVGERPVPPATDASAYDQLARDFADVEYEPSEGTLVNRIEVQLKALDPAGLERIRQLVSQPRPPQSR